MFIASVLIIQTLLYSSSVRQKLNNNIIVIIRINYSFSFQDLLGIYKMCTMNIVRNYQRTIPFLRYCTIIYFYDENSCSIKKCFYGMKESSRIPHPSRLYDVIFMLFLCTGQYFFPIRRGFITLKTSYYCQYDPFCVSFQ